MSVSICVVAPMIDNVEPNITFYGFYGNSIANADKELFRGGGFLSVVRRDEFCV